MTQMEEYARRQAAMIFMAGLSDRQRKGVGAGAEGGQNGQKNRGPSAAARAPEAEADAQGAFRDNKGATGAFAPGPLRLEDM